MAQQIALDSIKNEMHSTQNDTLQLLFMERIANEYAEINPDSALYYALQIPPLARKLSLYLEEIGGWTEVGYAYLNLGNYPRSLQTFLSTIALAADPATEKVVLPAHYPVMDDFMDRSISPRLQRYTKWSRALHFTGILYSNKGNFDKALFYYNEARHLAEQSNNFRVLSGIYNTSGRAYYSIQKPDSALICLQKAYDHAIEANYRRYLGSILLNLGRVYLSLHQVNKAKEYFSEALAVSDIQAYHRGVVASRLALAEVYILSLQPDSSLFQIQQGLTLAKTLNAPDLLQRSYLSLTDHYNKREMTDSIIKYQSLLLKINETIFNAKQAQQFQNIDFESQQRQQEADAARKEYKNRMQRNSLFGGLGTFLIIVLLLWRSNLQQKKANTLLEKQKDKIEMALSELKSTQALLIQSEKMASLGQLTAGIAHEIQNPLNFVNNFSEINKELIDEADEEITKGNILDARHLLNEIRENEQKIVTHGQRADAIVKGMLQHSRTGKGETEATDLNSLADEYLRICYHGYRAKDKSFNAELKTEFDPGLQKISIVPQDLGRVILNLLTNAFDAVKEKKRRQPDQYEPAVLLRTRMEGNQVIIQVKDNGLGIPPSVRDKIFQPFFTTKPSGQGTGLGLSLAYDIVKAHKGELWVESREGEYSEFSISLPVNH